DLWRNLTPLGRNEFICWVDDAKQPATRQRRIRRTVEELREGKRRPCCWAGCIHRTDKAPSRWPKAVLIDQKTKGASQPGRAAAFFRRSPVFTERRPPWPSQRVCRRGRSSRGYAPPACSAAPSPKPGFRHGTGADRN